MKKVYLLVLLTTMALSEIACICPSRQFADPSITEAPCLPRGRGGHAAGVVNGQVVVVGGTDWSLDHAEKFWLRDSIVLIDGFWQPGPSLPHPVAYTMYASDRTGLYMAGGTDGTTDLNTVYYLADAQNSVWKQLASLPSAMVSGSGAILNGKFYVTCGWNNQKLSNSMWVLDIRDPKARWQPCRSLPGAERAFPALAACGNYLYLLGGMSPNGNSLNVLQDFYQYSPKNDVWVRLKDLPWKGYGWAAYSTDKNHLLLAGKANGTISNGIYVLNVKINSTMQIGQTIIQTTTAPLINVRPNEYWLIGGEPDSNKTRTSVITSITFNVHNNSFQETRP